MLVGQALHAGCIITKQATVCFHQRRSLGFKRWMNIREIMFVLLPALSDCYL